jgi:hypothetical protein
MSGAGDLLPHANLCSILTGAPPYASARFPIMPIAAVPYRRNVDGLRVSCTSSRSELCRAAVELLIAPSFGRLSLQASVHLLASVPTRKR